MSAPSLGPVPFAPSTPSTIVELPYHRLLRAQPTYRWWRPLVALLLLAVFILIENIVIVVGVVLVAAATGAIAVTDVESFQSGLLYFFLPDAAEPLTLLIGLGVVALWLPLVPLALRIAGIRPAGFKTSIVNSVTLRLRWRWMMWCFVPAVTVLGLSTFASIGMGVAFGEPVGRFTTDPAVYIVSLAVILLIVPFQAAAEEFVFRGVMLQAIGSWLRWMPAALAVTTLAFVSLHIYEVWGLLDVAIFAVTAAFLIWRTGGLEAAIVLHVVNNVVGLAVMGTGMFGETGISPEGGSPGALVATALTMAVYGIVVVAMAKRQGIEHLSRIGIPEKVAPSVTGTATPVGET